MNGIDAVNCEKGHDKKKFFRYFFPTYENDSLLCSLEDDEDEEERVEDAASTK